MKRKNNAIQCPNEIFRGLMKHEDIVYLQKSLLQHDIILFYCWMEKHVIMHFLPQFSFKVLIDDIKGEKINPNFIPPCKKKTIGFKTRLDIMLNNAGPEIDYLFSSFFKFMFTREVLTFYRKIAEIVAPILDIDIISISRTLQNYIKSDLQKDLLMALVKAEFAYWSEKFVTSWYENLSNQDKIEINEVPIGPIAEYELMSEVILKLKKDFVLR